MEHETKLQMIHTDPAIMPPFPVPEAYEIRTFEPGEESVWTRIVNATIGLEWTVETSREELMDRPQFDPEGLFFATRDDEPVGTACAWRDDPGDEDVGVLHMVGVLPNHQGHGLGAVLCRHVLQYFADRTVSLVRLDTDDWRLPAIGLYLRLGFEPLCRDPSHEPRWQSVFAELEQDPPESLLHGESFEPLTG